MLPRSLSARLSLFVALGAAAVVGICLAVLYVALAGQLRSALDSGLVERSEDLEGSVQADDDMLARDPLAQLYAPDGRLVAGSAALSSQRLLTAREVQRVTGDLFADRTVTTARQTPVTEEVRVYARRINDAGSVLAVAVSAEPVREAGERLQVIVFLAAPLLVGLLGALGWLVVRAALRPVDRLAQQAAAISSLDTDGRLPVVPGDDEIARLARTLDAMLARLRVAFARERAFVDDASHELRTPIAVVQGELELALSAGKVPAEVAGSLRAALRETGRLSRLTQDLLQLARDRAGSLVSREPVDLLDLVRDHAAGIAPVLGLDIEVRGDPTVVDGDPERLRQVLTNLAGNSATAGATRADIHIIRGPGSATVEVADDGPGFPPDLLDAVFERFVRGDDARTRGSSGAGLGLSIVRAVIVAHGGTVEARNGPPLGGAVVTIRLPLP